MTAPGREIVVNASPEETRVVVLEGGKAAEILIERQGDRSLLGNVYLGRVDRVLPGMQAAFVDVGLARHAFLHVGDVLAPPSNEDDASGREKAGDGAPRADEARIEDLLAAGKPIVVQVTREPFGTKGARITTHVTLPGKYLVYMPLTQHLGISKRLTDEPVREELRQLMESLGLGRDDGAIVRTDAAHQPRDVVEAELTRLRERWVAMTEAMRTATAPSCLHEEPGLALRVVRDAKASELSRIVVDDEDVHARIVAYAREQAPDLVQHVHRFEGPGTLFESRGLEQEIEKALRDRVWLKSGGYLVINQMEALVAIDVNTGKFTGGRRLEETVLHTNLEAAREVARQLRLRDLGGIIVVDFIDMLEPAHRQSVRAELESAFARDRARTTVLGMSEFGLVEITRQRQKRSLERTLLDPCPHCSGSGRVKSIETVVNHVLRRLRALGAAEAGRTVEARVHPEVAALLEERLADLNRRGLGLPIRCTPVPEPHRHREAFDIGPTSESA